MCCAGAGVHKVWLASSAARWLPLSLVAAYAACDFVVQAALPAVAAASAAGLPTPSDGVLDFIKNVVGEFGVVLGASCGAY